MRVLDAQRSEGEGSKVRMEIQRSEGEALGVTYKVAGEASLLFDVGDVG